MCEHKPEDTFIGPRVPARWGSRPTEVCKCGMWRTQGYVPSEWTNESLEEAVKGEDEET